MAKYHYSEKAGRAMPCNAAPGNCPLNGGGEPHFARREEAERYGLERAAQKHSLFSVMTPPPPRNRPVIGDYFDGDSIPDEFTIYGAPEQYFDERNRRYRERGVPDRPNTRGGNWVKWQEENPGLALTPDPQAPKRVVIYRAGSMTPAIYKGEIGFYADEADYHRPDGAAPRHGSLFASSSPKSFRRWLRGNNMASAENPAAYEPHEITVDPNEVRVYHIPSWEKFSRKEVPSDEYWRSGMLLSRFTKAAQENNWNTAEWEVLVPPQAVQKQKSMSGAAVLKTLDEDLVYDMDREEISSIMKKVQRWRRDLKDSGF